MKRIVVLLLLAAGALLAAKEPQPGEPKVIPLGARGPVSVRVAFNQATLIKLPEGQRVMNVFGGDRGEGGVWAVDAGKVPTRYVAIKPKATGIHTTLHVVSNTGDEISLFVQEVTGTDSQFDPEVDVTGAAATAAGEPVPAVKWIPADEASACRTASESLKTELEAARKKAEEDAALRAAQLQTDYPKKLRFGYEWDRKRAKALGFEAAWSDDKFTYFRGKDVMALYEIDQDGKPSLIEYNYADGLYTAKKVIDNGYFAIGRSKSAKLTFHRDRSKP